MTTFHKPLLQLSELKVWNFRLFLASHLTDNKLLEHYHIPGLYKRQKFLYRKYQIFFLKLTSHMIKNT